MLPALEKIFESKAMKKVRFMHFDLKIVYSVAT